MCKECYSRGDPEGERNVMTETMKRTAGVMGGMGPDATVDFMARVIALTDSQRDQDHIHMIVDHDPTVPNRQTAIRGEDPVVDIRLAAMARRLEDAGADFLVMVCNTAHVFLDSIQAAISIPFISIIDESVREIENVCPDAQTVGLMATDGCLDTGIYQRAVESSGRKPLLPDGDELSKLMDLIHAVKAGDKSSKVASGMESVAQRLVSKGADVLIAGCTEIPIVFDGHEFSVPVVASTNVLARRTVELAKGITPLSPGTS
jgi:aspartate racemase